MLIHYERPDGGAPWLSWHAWAEVMRLPPPSPRGALHLSQYDQVIHAAVDGQGVAIATTPLVKDLIRAGKAYVDCDIVRDPSKWDDPE